MSHVQGLTPGQVLDMAERVSHASRLDARWRPRITAVVTNLVVGATGLVGREICRLLADQGRPVRALVRSSSDPSSAPSSSTAT